MSESERLEYNRVMNNNRVMAFNPALCKAAIAFFSDKDS
jgi:hypothetical protein